MSPSDEHEFEAAHGLPEPLPRGERVLWQGAPVFATMVERVGTTGVADGLWMDGKGRLFVTSPEDDALKLRTMDGTMTTLVQDKRLRWPDSLAEGPDGAIYVTSSHIQDMAQFHEKGSTRTQPYALWKLQPPR